MNGYAIRLAKAVLLFHDATQWGDTERAAWIKLTGRSEATTRVLGDLARDVLDEAAAQRSPNQGEVSE